MYVRIRRCAKVEAIDIRQDIHLRDFCFPGVSLEEGPLAGPLPPGHLDAFVAELVSYCCCTALLLGNPAKKRQKCRMKGQKLHYLLCEERLG